MNQIPQQLSAQPTPTGNLSLNGSLFADNASNQPTPSNATGFGGGFPQQNVQQGNDQQQGQVNGQVNGTGFGGGQNNQQGGTGFGGAAPSNGGSADPMSTIMNNSVGD